MPDRRGCSSHPCAHDGTRTRVSPHRQCGALAAGPREHVGAGRSWRAGASTPTRTRTWRLRVSQQSRRLVVSGRRASNPLLRFGRPTCPPSSPRPQTAPAQPGSRWCAGCPATPVCHEDAHGLQRREAALPRLHRVGNVCSTMHMSINTPPQEWGSVTHRRRESNPRQTVLETVALPKLADRRIEKRAREIEKPPGSVSRWAAPST